MKIATLKKYKTKLLKLKLLKTKIYKNKKKFNYLYLKNIEIRLKKILHIIYKFHATNKKILFVGTPLKLSKQIRQLLKRKKHSFIPESVWMSGVITNSESSFKHLFKKHTFTNDTTLKPLFNLKNQIDLIIILNENFSQAALKESSLKRVTTISLNSEYDTFNFNLATYKVSGNYNFTRKIIRNNFFFLLLNSIFKKAERLKKKQARLGQRHTEIKYLTNYRRNVFTKKK